ncbi:hypothetical protein C0995_011490 [Termitomyces sp. Mi166|nr:hypothetical protein C0995_011490 [Termitomyces sp. Mi166\
MAYLTLSTVLCIVGFQCPWIVIQFGWFVGWVYLRFYKKHSGDTLGGTVTYGDRSETFSLVSWFPPFLHKPLTLLGNFVFNLATRFHLIPTSNGDVEIGSYNQVPGSARAEAERRRALALKALDQRLANSTSPVGGSSSTPVHPPRIPPQAATGPVKPSNIERQKSNTLNTYSMVPTNASAPAISNGHVSLLHPLEKQATRANRTLSMSVSGVDDVPSTDVDPDELFAKHTISEVKFMQQRLRHVEFNFLARSRVADADAKQEELRLMVGERYRDLLQASTSIIAIATSAQRVKQALEEAKETILLQEEPPLPQQPSLKNGSDAHLHTLQLLSAHIKLLLDAPEHLWRLIERKKYFPAAWLFLLARVVHRALVREDEQDVTWSSQGVSVLDEFPLVQRQWDTVAQFRSQIIHKATLSLRDYDSSAEDTCAILLTLHLLDSRPLMESLSVFLAQRSKTLQSSLAWKYDLDSTNLSTKKQNGHAGQSSAVLSDFRRRPVKEIKEATQTALDAISRTVKTARSIFQEEDGCKSSLVRRVLEHIQSDSSTLPDQTQAHSTELYLTTQSLLTTLPSSTHFLLLPPDLRSYKPYVDLNSSSSSIQPSQFAQKLDEWFQTSILSLQRAVAGWFADLHSVKELWSVRASTLRWLSTSGLEKSEISEMTKILDESCKQRAAEIWRLKLAGSMDSFSQRLDSTLLSLAESGKVRYKEASPVNFLFQAPPIPNSTQSGLGSVDSSFQKYTSSLRRQLVGRTVLLDDVLATLESCARTIRQDLAHVMAGNESPELVKQLETTYRPDADALCANVIEKLERTANSPEQVPNTDGLVFISRVSDELSTSSPFVSEIGCQPSVLQDFRETTAALHNRVVDRWQTHTVSSVVREFRTARRPIHPVLTASLKPSGPSPELVQSLLALSTSIQDLGAPRSRPWQQPLVKTTLEHFVTELTSEEWEEGSLQSLYDMAFLQKLVTLHGEAQDELSSRLEKRLQENLPSDIELDTLHNSAADALSRTQTLFATLLPQLSIPQPDSTDKFSAFLRFGAPLPQEGQFQPAVEVAKPRSRFGLLLVGGA